MVTPAVLHLEDDRIGYLSAAGTAGKVFSGKLKIISAAPSGRTLFAAMRESYTLAGFAWAASGANGAYVSGPTAQAKYYRSQFDSKYKDPRGFPRPITNAGSQAACEATTGAGTFFWDTGTSKMYVHMWDGRLPDQADGWLWAESAYRFEIQQALSTNAGVILLENLEFLSNTGTALNAGCRYRPQTTGAVNTAIYGVKGCLVYGTSSNGFESYDGSITVFENNHARYCHVDGLNYHSFVTTGTKGEFISVYEYDCSAFDMGWTGWADQAALSNSANGSTSHDSLHTFRANTVVGDCHGAPIADVNGVHSINYNVQSSGPGSTPTFNSCFWHDAYLGAGTTKKMYLWGCSGWDNGDTTVNVLDNTAQAAGAIGDIYVSYWRGQTNGAVIGTLKDFAGNTL